MKILLSIIMLTLSSCDVAYAGYTLFVRPQVTPAYIVVNGAYGPQSRPNPGPPVIQPATFNAMLYQPTDYDPYSADPVKRTQLWDDTAGTATSAAILSACPGLKAKITAEVLQVRKDALAKITTDNAGVLGMYDANYAAAQAVIAGTGTTTLAKDGRTATVYLTAFGARLGMTAPVFANWIIAENQRVGTAASRVEDEYLRITYGVIPATSDVATILALPAQFRGFSGL